MKIFLCLLIFIPTLSFGQRADFFREDITFRLDSIHFDVEGYYWFANPASNAINSEIFYPFPYYSGQFIDSIRLYNISLGQKTKYNLEGSTGISFLLQLAPHDTVLFQIGYRQKLIGDSAVYILKTTKAWGKPINLAEYKLMTSNNFHIVKFSYPPDKSYQIEKQRIFYWRKENFMPVKDMIFSF